MGGNGFPEPGEQVWALSRLLDELGLSSVLLSPLLAHAGAVREQADRLGLVATSDAGSIVARHTADSLLFALVRRPGEAERWVDVGSGAGFPGLVLACCFPETEFVLVEPQGRRAGFLELQRTDLGLDNVEVVGARAEQLGREFDVAVARALAGPGEAVRSLLSLLGPRGVGVLAVGDGVSTLEGAEEVDVRRAGVDSPGRFFMIARPMEDNSRSIVETIQDKATALPGESHDLPGKKQEITRNTLIIAFANQKGGVGKTTTAVNLGACLAEVGAEVLLVDLDPQGNATTGAGVDRAAVKMGAYEVLGGAAPREAVMATGVEGFSIIPSTIDLAGAEVELVSAFARETKLRHGLEGVRGVYDFVLIDSPPSLGLLTVNALAACDYVVVPIQCEYYALEGVGQLVRTLDLVREGLNPRLAIGGVVLTMFDARTKLAEQVVGEVRRHFGETAFRTVIPRSVRLSEAPGFGKSIVEYDSSSRAALAHRELAAEVLGRWRPDLLEGVVGRRSGRPAGDGNTEREMERERG